MFRHALKFQPRFPSRVGKSLDAAVVLVSAPIKNHQFNFCGAGTLGDCLADGLRRSQVTTALKILARFAVQGTRRGQRAAGAVVNHLGVNMPERAIDAQARPLRRADHARAHTAVNFAAVRIPRHSSNRCRSHVPAPLRLGGRFRASLAGLFLQALAGHANAFLLVGVGWTQTAKVRSHLTNQALIRTADDKVRLLLDSNRDPFGNSKLDRMRISKAEIYGFAFEFGAIADAHYVQIFLEAFGYSTNGVGNQSPGQAVQRAMLFSVAKGSQHSFFLLEANAAGKRHGHLALGPLYIHGARMQRHLNTSG